jgi:hypothetical protein
MQSIIFVDVDDTLVRDIGGKVIPIPATVRYVRARYDEGAELYCWSSGGAEYAQATGDSRLLHRVSSQTNRAHRRSNTRRVAHT